MGIMIAEIVEKVSFNRCACPLLESEKATNLLHCIFVVSIATTARGRTERNREFEDVFAIGELRWHRQPLSEIPHGSSLCPGPLVKGRK